MSFTAEVKDDIARVEAVCPTCDLAELSALIRVCGTLSWRGPGRYSIRIATETGAVARTLIKLSHKVFDLETELTVRRSNLHKSRNYLIVIPEQPGLEEALLRMGILRQGRGVVSGIAPGLVRRECCRRAYLRGAFMAGGFIADPRGDFHLEIAVTGEDLAGDLVRLTASSASPPG
jgi:DNA-binding protein WhiA